MLDDTGEVYAVEIRSSSQRGQHSEAVVQVANGDECDIPKSSQHLRVWIRDRDEHIDHF